MNFKIVSDSSSNRFYMEGISYATVPLKIVTQVREYVDDENLNVAQMVEEIKQQSGRSGSSCPNVQEWLDAFEGADRIFAITITSNLSGSYSSAMQAKREYLSLNPDAKVCVLDSLSTGPEMLLIIEKLQEYIQAGADFDQIEKNIHAYMNHTHLLFGLKSLTNLARNGRVNPAMAAIAGALGICVIGKASNEGTLEQMHKCRGERKALKTMFSSMTELGFAGGKVRIDHCLNPEAAEQLKSLILHEYPDCDVQIGICTALCSFYAEKGGFLVGFEDAKSFNIQQ